MKIIHSCYNLSKTTRRHSEFTPRAQDNTQSLHHEYIATILWSLYLQYIARIHNHCTQSTQLEFIVTSPPYTVIIYSYCIPSTKLEYSHCAPWTDIEYIVTAPPAHS